MKQTSEKNRLNIAHVLLLYWVVLVAWQNIAKAQGRTGADVLLKIFLILLLTAFFVLRAKTVNLRNLLCLFPFAIHMVLVFWLSGDQLSGNAIIMYVFPVLLVLLSFVLGNDFQISKRQLRFFLNGVIIVVLYSAVYALLFYHEQFSGALKLQSAYGNELSSFFISSHEYGMYLVFAIFACFILNSIEEKRRIRYKVVIVILLPNLLLTFSRTAMLGLCVAAVVYFLLNSNARSRKRVFVGTVMAVAVLATYKPLRDFFELIVFKGQKENYGDRERLTEATVRMFREGTVSQKWFGHGHKFQEIFETTAEAAYGNTHNAYMQVLLCFGIIGLIFLVSMIISRAKNNLRFLKKQRFYASAFTAMLAAAAVMMYTNTAVMFTSPIDSFFLTMMAVLVPKYVFNSIDKGQFDIV